MKKGLLFIPLLISLVACNNQIGTSHINTSEKETVNMKDIMLDTAFECGFDLLTTDTRNGRALSGVLDYDGKAKSFQGHRPWMLSQWWAAQDLIDAPYQCDANGHHIYENRSRRVEVNSKDKEITLSLSSYQDYMDLYGRTRKDNEMWSHLLLEQNFNEPAKLAELDKLIVHLEFNIKNCDDMDKGQAVPCSQISWYFTVTDVKNGESAYESQYETKPNDFFWFGLPLFDSRYEFTEDFHHVDKGFTGATNKLIYSTSNRHFLNEPIKFNKNYTIELDILPLIKQAYIYGLNNGAMENSNWKDLVVNYMNIGWENPGSYNGTVTFKNFSLKAQYKGDK